MAPSPPTNGVDVSDLVDRLVELPAHRGGLAPEHIERFYTFLEADGLTPATVLQIHRILARALKVAMQRGYVARNVAALIDGPSVAWGEVEPLTLQEALRTIDLVADRRNGTRWSVALALGLWRGEALVCVGSMWISTLVCL